MRDDVLTLANHNMNAETQTKAHTPGPWENANMRIVSDSRYVATVDDWSNPECAPHYSAINDSLKAEAEANARLIAAAPELLAALEYYASAPWVGHAGSWANSNIAERARKAIAKATSP